MKHIWKDAEDEFVSFFAPFGKRAHVQRFSDTAFIRGASGKTNAIKDAQPADYIVTWEGSTFYSEVKSTVHETSFSFSMIKKNQWAAARQVVAADGLYYFWIRSEIANQWYVIPARVLIEHAAKSIKWVELQSYKLERFQHFSQLAK